MKTYIKEHWRRIVVIATAALLLLAILTVSLIFGLASCNKSGIIPPPEINTTVRKEAPTDGSSPEEHTALDNIAYMAYVLDRQPFYHAYANNSTKSTGYEQVTQTWKDYRLTEIDGKTRGVMVCSDLSYSALVKSASQACFLDNLVAFMRTGGKPSKQSTPSDIEWSADQPRKYEKEKYLTTYGEFSTELSVYVINEDTVESAGETVNNGDGTYSQTFRLNAGAAYWYQYGMKTRGGLKNYPVFEKIEITFTFDGKWQVLSSYCEEKAQITPGALGGIPLGSNSKTTTTFDYGEQGFDGEHYGYVDSYYSAYFDKNLGNDDKPVTQEVSVTDVLMGGFKDVISDKGQQFALELNAGANEYDGKIYLKLTDLGDVLNTIDARISLGKKGSGQQDFYAEFRNKTVNAYYSDGFAVTADIDRVSAAIGAISAWIKGGAEAAPAAEGGGFDLSLLLEAFKMDVTDASVAVTIKTDNLLGLGIGVDLELNFDRKQTDGISEYSFVNLAINSLSFENSKIALSAAIVPDNTEIISRNPSETAADIADYMDGVLALLKSKSYIIDFNLDYSGIKASANARVELGEGFKTIKVNAPLSVEFNGLSVELAAYYTVNLESGDFGEVYINLTKLNGKDCEAKAYCNIKDLVSSVQRLIALFEEPAAVYASVETRATVAEVINTILNLDFAAIVTELKADENAIRVSVNADIILDTVLAVLGKEINIELGTATLSVILDNGKVSLDGSVSGLGLAFGIAGSEEGLPEFDNNGYADITEYVDGIYALLNSNTYSVRLGLDGTFENVKATAEAFVKLDGGYKNIAVSVPEIKIDFKGLTATLGVYYTVNLENGGYGKVYINLTELGGKEVSAKIYCDIKDAVDAVTALINSFNSPDAAVYAGVVESVLSIDFSSVITELKICADEFKLGLNADEILKAANFNLGFNLGNVELNIGLADGKANLSGKLPSLGLTVALNGSDADVNAPDKNAYADLTAYVNGLSALLASNSFGLGLNLDAYGVKLNADALVKFTNNFNNIEVYVPALTVTYQTLTVVLDVKYSIDLQSGSYGNVYLNVTELGGKAVSAKVYCDISETVEAVKKIIAMFETPAAAYAEGDKVSGIIGSVVAIDFKALIENLTADNTGINLAINADEILKLLNINIDGFELGTVALSVKLDGGKIALNGEIKSLGLTLALSGSDKAVPSIDKSEYADLASYVNGVYNLLNSESFEVTLAFNGAESGIAEVKDITASTVAQVKLGSGFNSVTVNAPITVNYKDITVGLEIYYALNFGNGYGNAYITLNNINGQPFAARVKCDIGETVAAVKELIALFKDGAEPVADIVGTLVSLDFAKLIGELTADNTGVNLSVNLDEALKAFNVSLGLQLGYAEFNLGIDDKHCATLEGAVPAIGLTQLKLGGSDNTIPAVDENKYLDLAEILRLVKEGALEVKAIMAAEGVEFGIEKINLTVDGIKMSVSGYGQASWANGAVRVAADLALTISEGAASETLALKLVYDETSEQLVRLAVNNLGLVITKTDIANLSGGLNEIIDIIGSAMNGGARTASVEETSFEKILNALLGFASDLKVELQTAVDAGDDAVKQLVISYADNGVLTLGANGGLSLKLFVKDYNGTEIADIALSACTPVSDKFAEINGLLDGEGYTFYGSDENTQFTKALYDYVFAVLEDLTVKDLLGSDTYTVTVELDGDASGIAALKGVYVNASLYYTETDAGEKLVEIEISNLSINGTAVVASASYYNDYFYIVLGQVGDTYLYSGETPIMIKASRHEIYNAADALVKIITSENMPALLALIGGNTAMAAEMEETQPTATQAGITKILNAIFKLAIDFNKVDGENTLTLDIDGMLAELGLGVTIGEIKIAINPETHAISATAVKDGKAWVSLKAFADAESTHGVPPEGEYIDIDFVATLLADIGKTLDSLGVNDGKPDFRISLTGDIRVDIKYSVISTNITINNVVLTAGLNSEDKFYFTLGGDLQSTKFLGFNVAKAMPVSVTFSDNYLTMGRTDDNGNKIYKVMTLEYLIDNLLDKNNSPVRWLLGVDSTPWGLICDNVKLPINSGLTGKQSYYLYEAQTETPDQPEEGGVKTFNLATTLLGMSVRYDGYSSLYGNNAADVISGLGLSDNYYAFDLNLSSFIGNTISKLYAAIVRNADGGLKGVKAYAALDGDYLSVKANLADGLIAAETDDKKHAPDFYKEVNPDNSVIDFNYFDKDESKIFGCYNTQDGSYNYSDFNKSYNLNVYVFEGEDYDNYPSNVKGGVLHETHRNISLKSGSTVYMLPEELWLDEAHTRKLIYVDEGGNDLGLSFTIKSDMNIYLMIVGENSVSFFDGFGNACPVIGSEDNTLSLYVGDALPLPQSLTAEKDGVEYTFAGWYQDEAHEILVSSVQAGITEYYAKYLETYTTLSNGITYKFTYDNTTAAGGFYTAYSFDNSVADKDYTLSTSTLIVADYIGAYPVTVVGKDAFKAKSIKNIVVPETVARVEAQAFMDNKGMLSAVFLADTVRFGGNAWDGDNRFVFYGCGISTSNETQTYLQIYYNYATSENDNTDWMGFYRGGNAISRKYYYIGGNGGSRNGSRIDHEGKLVYEGSKWAYVTYTTDSKEFTLSELGLWNYLTTSESYNGPAVRDILNAVDGITAEKYGYIGGYEVVLVGDYSLPYGRVNLTVEVNKLPEAYYEFSFNGNSEVCSASYAIADEDIKENGDGKIYVRKGATVSLEATAAGSYKFDGWNINGEIFNGNSVVINGVTSVTAVWSANYAKNIYVVSETNFTYGGVGYSAGGVKVENAAMGELLETPVAAGYAFLGWATADGEQLAVSDSVTVTEEAATYYPLWVAARNDVTFAFDKASNKLTATVTEGEINGWYKGGDENYENMLSADSAFTFTASKTSVRIRLQYTMSIKFTAQKTKVYNNGAEMFYVENDKQDKIFTYTVLENNSLNLSLSADNLLLKLSVSDQFDYEFKARKWEYSWFKWQETGDRKFNDNAEHTITVNGETLSNGTGSIFGTDKINGNIAIDIAL